MPVKVIPREFASDLTSLRSFSERIVDALIAEGITHVVGVPDNATRIIFDLLAEQPEIQIVSVCREGEAWAIASGLWVGGKVPIVLIQNTGLFESGDALRGTAMEMCVPLLAFMDYRGYHTLNFVHKERADSAALLFEPTMNAWELPYLFLQDKKEHAIIREALTMAQQRERPVAVLMT